MKTLKNSDLLIYSDSNYTDALNFNKSLYNFPITLNQDGKKIIIAAGNSDNISILQSKDSLFVIAENTSLTYIGMEVYNVETLEQTGNVFLTSNDIDIPGNLSSNILKYGPLKQVKILCEYL